MDFSTVEAAAKELFTEGGDLTQEIIALLKAVLALVFGFIEEEEGYNA